MNNNHILLVEDDQEDQDFFILALTAIDHSIKCTVMNRAEEALAYLSQQIVPPDLIFLDLKLPGMSGMEFLEEIRKNNLCPNTPIVILSANNTDVSKNLAESLGCRTFLYKPNSVSKLEDMLRSVIGDHLPTVSIT